MSRRLLIPRLMPPLALMVFLFYSLNMDSILGLKRYNPYVYQGILLMGVLGIYLLRTGANWLLSIRRLVTHPVLIWAVMYIGLSMVSLVFVYHIDYGMKGLLYSISTLVMLAAMVSGGMCPEPPSKWSCGGITFCVLIVACVSLLLDPIFDFRAMLGVAEAGTYDRTRAGGLYFQPNIAGCAIPFLLATVLPRVRPMPALVATMVAVISLTLTFSRSGMILVALITTAAFLRGYLPRIGTLVLVLGCAAMLAMVNGTTLVQDVFHIDEGSGLARLTLLNDFVGRDALTSDARLGIASLAWQDICLTPLTGGGTGYSWYWADVQPDQSGTHNMYLRHMLEFGIPGGLLWPLCIAAMYIVRNRALDRAWVVSVLSAALLAGMFSHNLTEQGVFLVVLLGSIYLPVVSHKRHGVMT